MEVICIKTSIAIDNDPRTVLVFKGSRYHVTEVKEEALFGFPKTIWYRLLETGDSLHSYDLFALAPPLKEEILSQNKFLEQ